MAGRHPHSQHPQHVAPPLPPHLTAVPPHPTAGPSSSRGDGRGDQHRFVPKFGDWHCSKSGHMATYSGQFVRMQGTGKHHQQQQHQQQHQQQQQQRCEGGRSVAHHHHDVMGTPQEMTISSAAAELEWAALQQEMMGRTPEASLERSGHAVGANPLTAWKESGKQRQGGSSLEGSYQHPSSSPSVLNPLTAWSSNEEETCAVDGVNSNSNSSRSSDEEPHLGEAYLAAVSGRAADAKRSGLPVPPLSPNAMGKSKGTPLSPSVLGSNAKGKRALLEPLNRNDSEAAVRVGCADVMTRLCCGWSKSSA